LFKPKYILVLLLVLGVITSGGVFYMHSTQNEGKETITLRVWESEKNMLHLPLYIAMQEGYFAEQGIKIQLLNSSEIAAKNPYADDLADIILTDPVDCLYQKSVNPAAPVIVASLAHRDGTFLLAREKETISWENLKNRNVISYPPETGPGLAMEKIIRGAGMVPMRDLCLYNRIPDKLRLGVFKSGSGSYIQLTGAQAFAAEKNGAGIIIARLGEAAGDLPSVLCTVKPDIIGEHAEAVQGFVNAIYKAQLWLQNEPEIGAGAAKVYLSELDKTIRDKLLEEYITMKMWTPDPQITESTFNGIKQLMVATGQIAVPLTYDSAVNNSYARQAVKVVQYIPKAEREKSWFGKIID